MSGVSITWRGFHPPGWLAQRKAGELIARMEKAKNQHDAKKVASNTPLPATKKEQLDSIGINKMQASRLERMAAVPEEKFEELASPSFGVP